MSFTNPNLSSSQAEYDALGEGAGFRILEDRALIRVTGDDRASFFHGICSADVNGAKPGDVLPALFLTEHAHVIGDFFIWVEEGALMLEADASAWPREREHLEKLLVADDVEIEDLPNFAVLHVEGPRAAGLINTADVPKPWRWITADRLIVGNMPRLGTGAYSMIGERDALNVVVDRLARAGATEVSDAALDIIRVENGIAKAGRDTNDKTIALEARMERAISFNKGCYLGQETIERATSRGGLKKRLFGLRFDAPIAPGTQLLLDGKEVGHVTSAVISPRLGAIGLAILHHSAWTPGLALIARDPKGDIKAVVSDLPFDK